jgi:hypothetical protein
MSAQNVPTSYEAAKRIGDAKYKSLLKTNSPDELHYIVLSKGNALGPLLKYDNAIYVIDKNFDLEGKTVNVPTHSVFVFRNGRVMNGTLYGLESKYCVIGSTGIKCRLMGSWERIAPLYTASELGLIRNDESAGNINYSRLKNAIKKGVNLYFDGKYYVFFSKPILLRYQLHVFGGKVLFSKHAFDLASNGGLFANGVHFSSINGSRTDDIVCGTREKHSAITTAPLTFLNCHFSCNRVISLEFQYTNPILKPFGVSSIVVSNCYADDTAKFLVLDAVIKDGFRFTNNIWEGFATVPIYIVCSHSKRSNPREVDANPWAEETIAATGDVIIDSNVFIGKEVKDGDYYCTALVKANKCWFSNNFVKDIIAYSDKSGGNSTAYDAYLSCVEVYYRNNYIEGVMSYSKDGASKPQCEIGKSKTNPLSEFGVKASREYTDNIFLVNGKRFLAKGADPQSLYANLFYNSSAISRYTWDRNSIVFRNAKIEGRHSSSKYGSFSFRDNYFECESFSGNLVFPNSAFDQSDITLTGNTFLVNKSNSISLFNQLFDEQYEKYNHGSIRITDNRFINAVPLFFFFCADTVRIQRNIVKNASLNSMAYLNNYSGSKFEAAVSVRDLDVDYPLDTRGLSKGGGIRQVFSAMSSGVYSIKMRGVPEDGVNYTYVIGNNHSFRIFFSLGSEVDWIDFYIKGGEVSYSHRSQAGSVRFVTSESIVWNTTHGVTFKTSFLKGSPNRIVTSLSGQCLSDIVFEYQSR